MSAVYSRISDPVVKEQYENGLVAFDFARPAAFGGVLDELLLACQANPEAGGVLAGGEELRAAQVEIKMSR
jgi:hypothetical protein